MTVSVPPPPDAAVERKSNQPETPGLMSFLRHHPAAAVLTRIAPAALWMLLFLVIPLILVCVVSFATRGIYGGVVYKFTLGNFQRFLEPLYVRILLNSVGVAFVTVAACLLLGYPFAYYIARAPQHIRGMLMMLVIIPFWTNFLIRTYAWMALLRTEGIINTFLLKVGLIHAPLSLLYNDGAVLLGMIYGFLPFMVLPLYSSIEKLDFSLLEAAQDLGASRLQTLLKVILPLTLPGIVAGSILVFVPALGMFIIPDLLGGAKSMLIGNLIQNQFLAARNWPFGSAASIIMMIVSLGLIFLYQRLTKSGAPEPKRGEV